jgi:hypothetical protein
MCARIWSRLAACRLRCSAVVRYNTDTPRPVVAEVEPSRRSL